MALGLGILACERSPSEGHVFRYHLLAAPTTLDPALSSDVYSGGVIDRLFDGLMRLDRVRNLPEPLLASSFEVSEDGRTYTFRLRPEARFHNGRTIRAEDVVYSFTRVLDPATESPRAWLFEMIEGAEDFVAGADSHVRGLEAIDEAQVRIRLDQPFAAFLYHLAEPAASIVPREVVERLGAEMARHPVGSGPFRLESWDEQAGRVELHASPTALRAPGVKRLIFETVPDANEALRRYLAGNLDLLSAIPAGSLSELQRSLTADLRLLSGLSWYGFCFRADHPPFDDPRVRRALALAIDRDRLVERLGAEQYLASVALLPEPIPGADAERLTHGYDPQEARRLLEQADAFDADRPLLFATRTSELDQEVASFLADSLAEIGLSVEVRHMDFAELFDSMQTGRLGWFRFGWGGWYPDPHPYFRPLFHSAASSNLFAYSEPEVDTLLQAATREGDPHRRRDLYRQTERRILEDAPCVGLYQRTEAILLRPRWTGLPLGYHPAYLEIERVQEAK